MEGIKRAYLNAAILAVLKANQNLGWFRCEKALQKVPYGKFDTLELDATPENTIQHVLLQPFENPSYYRGTILVTHKDNSLITGLAQGQNARRLELSY